MKYILLAFLLTIVLFSLNTLRIYEVIEIFNENQYHNYERELSTITTNVKKVSDTIYANTINIPKVIDIFKNAHKSNELEKTIIRDRLYNTLKNNYDTFTTVGIQQLHFHLPNNDSFLRFHKPGKFGDSLTKARDSVRYVNEMKMSTSGFEEGKIFNGHRFVYPLFDKNNTHIGSVEISSSLLSFKKTFESINELHIDYILTKKAVESKVFKSQLNNYVKYHFLENFYIQKTLYKRNNLECIDTSLCIANFLEEEKIYENLLPIRKQIHFKIIDNKIYTIYFIPLLNDFTRKNVGYTIIMGESDYMKYFSKNIIISYIVFFFLSILIAFIFYRNKRLLVEQNEKNKFLLESNTDELTKLCNRKYYNQRLFDEIGTFKRYSTTFSIILCDIDHFKVINDNYGHDIGDEVLKDIGKLLKKSFRSSDHICRIGGEEFVIVLPHLNLEQALILAESVRHNIEQDLNTIEGKTITISLGVTEVQNQDTVDTIFKRADKYLYSSKENGRNMISSDLSVNLD